MQPDVVQQHKRRHQHHHQAQRLADADGLAADGPVEQVQAVGPQPLDPEPSDTVPQEVEPCVLTVKAASLRHDKDDQQQSHYVPQALVQERRMHLHQRPRGGGQLHPPGQRRLRAEGLPVHEVAPAAHRLPDQETHHDQVRQRPQLEAPLFAEHEAHQHRRDHAAVDGQSTVPDGDGLRPVKGTIRFFEPVQIEQHIVQPRPHDSQGNAPQHAVHQVILGDPVLLLLLHAEPQRQQHAQRDDDSVPINGLSSDMEGYGRAGKGPVPEKPRKPDGAVRHDPHVHVIPPWARSPTAPCAPA